MEMTTLELHSCTVMQSSDFIEKKHISPLSLLGIINMQP